MSTASAVACRDRWFAAGLCCACGKQPARKDRVNCWDCGLKASVRNRWGSDRVRRCGLCRSTEHNRQRCARLV